MPSFGFEIKPIEDEPQDDPRLMSANQIRAFAQQGGLMEIVAAARAAFRRVDSARATAWPEVLLSQGLSCQTVAIVNGMRCYQAAANGRVWTPSRADVSNIRREAAAIGNGTGETLEAALVARWCVQQGLLRSVDQLQQPITAAEKLADRGFAVVTSGDAFHAIAIVPNLAQLVAASGSTPELIAMDSLNGKQTAMSMHDFCTMMLEQDWRRGDETIVCAV